MLALASADNAVVLETADAREPSDRLCSPAATML
jgi:hypothetical protein